MLLKDPTHLLDATTQRNWIRETFKIGHAGSQTSHSSGAQWAEIHSGSQRGGIIISAR
jgi:hypothetical protein